MKGFAYVAATLLVVVGVTVGAIALVGAWSSQSYPSASALLLKLGCPAQEIRTVGSWASCGPPVSLGPTDISAMTFKAGSSPSVYLRRHQAEFVGSEASVVYGPNWLVQISSSEIYLVTSEVVKATGGTVWHATDQETYFLTLCQSVTHLDRLIVHRTNANPQLHLHFPFPSVVIVTNATSVQDAAKALCALPRMPKGVFHWSQAVNIRNRSYALRALVDIPAPGASGVIFAQGSRFGGHALYIKDNRLHYTYNFFCMDEQKVVGGVDVPTGEKLILAASFDKDGQDAPGVATGMLSLFHGDTKVGEGRIKTQPGKFSLAGEGLCVGRDSGEPVTGDYPGKEPHRFTGGTINRVAVDVSGEPFVDLEREAVAMMSRE